MSRKSIIRAWKDEEYRRGLSEAERAAVPDHPAGLIDLGNAELGAVEGGLPGSWFKCTDTGCSWFWECK
jgi:mersacidin/lichenicidin family type 2 lantibiotic